MTLVAVLGSAAAICAGSVVVGQAVWRLAGFAGWSWLAGPVGLATLVAVSVPAAELPGAGGTAAVVLLGLVLAAVLCRPRGVGRGMVAETAAMVALGLATASLPFIAAGRVGILAVTDNADFFAHLMLADSVRSGRAPVGLDPGWYANYPTGPHSLVAALAAGLGVPVDSAFTGLLLATLALAALTALFLLRELGTRRRLAGALIAGIPYLGASYTIQASFKETLLGLLVIGWALSLPAVAAALRSRPRAILPLLALAAGAYGDYGVVGLAWLGIVAVVYLAATLVTARSLPGLTWSARWTVGAGLLAAIVALAAIPQLPGARALVGAVKDVSGGATTGGNIRAELPSYEVFGVWLNSDLRPPGAHLQLERGLGLLATAAALWAAWWWWRRRRPELPAAAAATLGVYAGTRLTATPYYSGKALAIAAFAVGLMTVGALVAALPSPRRLRTGGAVRATGATVGVVFLVLAAWSSALALRGGRVAPAEHTAELASLRPLLKGSATLYMGQNNYIPWILRGTRVAFPYIDIGRSQVAFDVRPDKGWTVESGFDFDSIAPEYLDRFRFALAPRTPYASQPPLNWRLVRQTRSYEVWERHGATAPRAVLPEQDAPGGVLDCASPLGRDLQRRAGHAAVRTPPVVVPPTLLRARTGQPLPMGQFHRAQIASGDDALATVRLPPGRWTLSLQYVSPGPLDVTVDGERVRAVPSMDGPGAFWRIGTFTGRGGATLVEIHAKAASPLEAFRTVLLGSLAFTPAGERDRVVPLRAACGRYVDWYQETEPKPVR
jgi:hypothetical protein